MATAKTGRIFKIFWTIGSVLLIGGMIALALRIEHNEEAEEREREAVSAPRQVHRGKVELGEEVARNAGIKTTPAEPATWVERVAVYGRVVPNPKGTIDLRAPFAGAVQSGEDVGWPQLGQIVHAGEPLGILDIRVGPQERLDLEAKLKEAGLRNQGAIEVEKVQRDRADRLRSLTNSDIVSRRELVDALVALSEAQTQLATTKAALQLWTTALAEINDRKEPVSRWRMPLISPADGEITQVLVRPGAAVEAGSPLVRIVNFRHLLVRLDIPPDLLKGPPPPLVRLFVEAGAGAMPAANAADDVEQGEGLEGRLIGTAPQVDVTSQWTSYWYEASAVPSDGQPWRPGLFIKSLFTRPNSQPRPAMAVPLSAVLWHEGQAWVYVQDAPGQFARRAVELLGRENGHYLLGAGIQVGEAVVSQHAQVLLSEEFRTEGESD